MRNSVNCCRGLLLLLLIALLAANTAISADVRIDVSDRRGDPLPDVAVYLVPSESVHQSDSASRPVSTAVVEQIDNAFVPHISVIEAGTHVSFPNNDSVSHHVYSFSEPKSFQLDLYRGNAHPPEIFDAPGLVVIGCNIHDGMLAYILVVDTPHSSISTADGAATFADVQPGIYDLHVWAPRVAADAMPAPRSLTVGATGQVTIPVQITSKLRPPHGGVSGSLSWDDY